CGQTKALAEFSPSKICKDGHQNVCKPCAAEEHRTRYWANVHVRKSEIDAGKASSAARYVARKAAGLCAKCDQPLVPGTIFCEDHREVNRAASRRRFSERRAKGRCLRCGRSPVPGLKYC